MSAVPRIFCWLGWHAWDERWPQGALRPERFCRECGPSRRVSLRSGDPVIYLPDPLLYGEMEFYFCCKGGDRVCCKVDPDSKPAHFELFAAREIGPVKAVVA